MHFPIVQTTCTLNVLYYLKSTVPKQFLLILLFALLLWVSLYSNMLLFGWPQCYILKDLSYLITTCTILLCTFSNKTRLCLFFLWAYISGKKTFLSRWCAQWLVLELSFLFISLMIMVWMCLYHFCRALNHFGVLNKYLSSLFIQICNLALCTDVYIIVLKLYQYFAFYA